MSSKNTSNCILAREVCQLKALVRAQNKQLCLLIKQVKDEKKGDEEGAGDKESSLHSLNPFLDCLKPDILYHLALDTESMNFPKVFGDVRFVCMGGTPQRMQSFASFVMGAIGLKMNAAVQLKDMSAAGHRFAMFKAGPVLCVSHGIGCPSISVVLNELIKMMYHAKCQDPVFIRIGTCGGIGVAPGTVVITKEALNGELCPKYELIVQGKPVQLSASLNAELAKELLSLSDSCNEEHDTILAKTLCADDFYEGQSRLDGAFCNYTSDSKKAYLQKLADNGIANIEMESLAFAALTNRANIRAAVVCHAIVNRLDEDQINATPEMLNEWQLYVYKLVASYILRSIYGSSSECELDNEVEEELKMCSCDDTGDESKVVD